MANFVREINRSNKPMKKAMLFTWLIMLTFSAFAKPILFVEVFTDSSHSVKIDESNAVIKVHYYLLDESAKLMKKINFQLKSLQAQGIPKAQLLSDAKEIMNNYKMQLKHSYLALSLAAKYKLTKYPAFVFDRGKKIIYGEINLSKAIAKYKHDEINL